jgi:hypothetical protein
VKLTRNIEGGYFDGPRAWKIIQDRLLNIERSDADKDYYRVAWPFFELLGRCPNSAQPFFKANCFSILPANLPA